MAIKVKDCRALFDKLMGNGAKCVQEPHEISDEHGSAVVASVQTYGDTVHTVSNCMHTRLMIGLEALVISLVSRLQSPGACPHCGRSSLTAC